MIGKEQLDGNMPGKWPEAQRAVGDIAACMQASVWGANPICFSFTLFVWSNLWIMKNKRHQCAEVQLKYMPVYICNLSFPHYFKFQSSILSNFDAIARPLPFYLLVTPPYYFMYVQLCRMSLDPIATPLRRVDQSVPREFSWWGQVMHSSWMDQGGWNPQPKVSEKI